jgi:hypothetical protein
MIHHRPDATQSLSYDGFIRLYEYLSKRDFNSAKRHTRKDFAVVCPLHQDDHASMSFDPEGKKWYCPVCKVGGGIAHMVLEFGPADFHCDGFSEKQRLAAAFRWLRKKGFVPPDPAEEEYERRRGITSTIEPARIDRSALREIPNPKSTNKSGFPVLSNKKCTVFPYTDAAGNVEYEVLRFDGTNSLGEPDKYFLQRTVLPAGGAWLETASTWQYTIDGVGVRNIPLYANGKKRRKPSGPYIYERESESPARLFLLPEVIAAAANGRRIFVVEGEKKALALRARTGECVTTWAGGANSELQISWLRDIAGAESLWVFADCDPYKPGRKGEMRSEGREAALERAHFFRRVVFDVRMIDLFPGRGDKSDVDDWLKLRPNAPASELLDELEAVAAHTEPIE